MTVPGRDPAAMWRACCAILIAGLSLGEPLSGSPRFTGPRSAPGPQSASDEGFHAPLDELLDLYVRDGFVYYRALKSDRARLDRYLARLDVPAAVYNGWSRARQLAFWINAYNACVLRTVIDHYPIRGRTPAYPPDSIRQIPGAFDGIRYRLAGRSVTLDEIEYQILPAFEDPRVYFALGRGAAGSPRLRSEAFTADRLESQLALATREVMTTPEHVRVDEVADELLVTAVIGWHDAEFARAFGGPTDGPFAARSPIERAILELLAPYLLPRERALVARNTFSVRYLPFDWRLNDLTGR